MNLFEEASRRKFRYAGGPKGEITIEQLWELPLDTGTFTLDEVAKGLHKQLKSGDDMSFVVPERKSDPTIQMKFDLVIHVINTRIMERNAAVNAQQRAAQKQRILAIMAEHEDADLRGKSKADLEKLLAEL